MVENMDQFHIINIGTMIEKNEDSLRSIIIDQYVNKQREITNTGRYLENQQSDQMKQQFYDELNAV